jgi:NTE family protein
MNRQITGVFEGGGVRGIALTGAAAAALDAGYEFQETVGTSAGAIVSALVAAGFNSTELERAVVEIDWPNLLENKGFIRKNLSMLFRLGFHSGRRLEGELISLLAAKGIHTFGDLTPGRLRVVATDLNHGRGLVFPDDLGSLGHDQDTFPVAKAVLMSSSVPFVFEPVRLNDRITGEDLLLADGAMAARFPVQLAARAPSTIGFRLRLPENSHLHQKIVGPVSLATAVIGAGITAREDLPLVCGPLDRVVEVVVDHDSLDFDVSPSRAADLFQIGYRATETMLSGPSLVA